MKKTGLHFSIRYSGLTFNEQDEKVKKNEDKELAHFFKDGNKMKILSETESPLQTTIVAIFIVGYK